MSASPIEALGLLIADLYAQNSAQQQQIAALKAEIQAHAPEQAEESPAARARTIADRDKSGGASGT